jgi:hypothetical protein
MQIAKVKVFSNKAVVENRGSIVAGTVGATVLFDFDPEWDEMDSITLVWQAGEVVKDDTMATGTVPQEVLEHPGVDLKVGVYGTKGDTATPTRWANLGHIYSGADPSGDPSTDPALPVWAQADQKISLAQKAAQEAQSAAAEAQAAAEVTETFAAKYGTTEHGEILEAYRAGKVCVCVADNSTYLLSQLDEEKAVFTGWTGHGLYYRYTCTAPKSWALEYDTYFKTKGISATSTDDQIPTAAAVYKAMQEAGMEPEIYIGTQATPYSMLLSQAGNGKLVFVRESAVARRLYQLYDSYAMDGHLRFYRVDGDGIHWLAVDRENVWSRGSKEETQEVFRASYDGTSYDEIQAAADGGKFCFLKSGSLYMPLVYAYNGQAVFSAYHPVSGKLESATVTDQGWTNANIPAKVTESISASSTHNQLPTAKAVYNALKEAGASGEFDGEDGGYYTPEFDDVGGGLVEVNFYKSKETMPDVPMKQLALPEGMPGKSAYIFAQEAGYSGTEEEFGEKLAQEETMLLVHISSKPGSGVTADKPYREIYSAYQSGKPVMLMYGRNLYVLQDYSPSGIVFYPLPTAYNSPNSNKKWTVTSADVWSNEDAGIPFATTEVTADSTDGALPTAKAVHTAIRAANNRKYQLIRSLEVTEPVNKIEFADLNLDEFTIFMQAPLVETSVGHDVIVENTAGTMVFYNWPGGTIHTDYPRNCCWHVNRNKGYVEGFFSIQTIASNSHLLAPKPCQMTHSYVDGSLPFDTIKMHTYSDTLLFPVGLKIEVWGLAADE